MSLGAWKDRIYTAAVVLLAVCAVVITGLLVRREVFGPRVRPSEPSRAEEISDWQELARWGHRVGPPSAPVTLVVFLDYECPYCRQLEPIVDSLRAKYVDRLAVVYRHFPLESLHPNAYKAALIAECAAEQGRFRAVHDLLFDVSPELESVRLSELAELGGVEEIDRFEECVETERLTTRIEQDVAAAEQIGVTGTPAVIINGHLLRGLVPYTVLDRLVQKSAVP